MSVPIHNLYDYIYQVLENRFLVYYFYPFGSKKMVNLVCNPPLMHTKTKLQDIDPNWLPSEKDNNISRIFPKDICNFGLMLEYNPLLICNDQEPLDFVYYENNANHTDYINNWYGVQKNFFAAHTKNLRWVSAAGLAVKKYIVLHSEINSQDVSLYENSGMFECAFYWSHALISLDWYRYAKHDKFLQPGKQATKTFLIYCRDTTGKRQYRQKFLSFLKHYEITDCQIGSFFDTDASADSSAEYNYKDFNQSSISVVLETCYDSRIHLTEKVLRCIACGHPFLLAAGPGSLEFLKSYGFKTFHPFINEDYDTEKNDSKRLRLIAKAMQKFCKLSHETKEHYLNEMYKIAKFNKELFFSEQFSKKIVEELINNVNSAYKRTNNEFCADSIWQYIKHEKQNNMPAYRKNPKRPYVLSFLKHLKKGGTLENYVPPWEK